MLSDKEKELIEKLQKGDKIGIYELIRTFKREGIENFITVRRKYINIMINLIEKQQKEIEELKWKPVKDYDRKKYDWVLVKYFDGDYECVPEVAEKRSDGKWYTSERQISFEVKYFFDMQKILKEE